MISYPIKLTPDEDTLLASSRDFPELVTFGFELEDSLEHAANALQEAVAARMAYRQEIPAPSKPKKGERLVSLPMQATVKIMLYMDMQHQGLRKSELARRIGVHKQEMDRLFSLNHATSFAKIEKAFSALGKRLDFEVVDA